MSYIIINNNNNNNDDDDDEIVPSMPFSSFTSSWTESNVTDELTGWRHPLLFCFRLAGGAGPGGTCLITKTCMLLNVPPKLLVQQPFTMWHVMHISYFFEI